MTPTAADVNPRIRGLAMWISVRVSETKVGVLSKESVKLFSPWSSCFLNNRWLTLLEKIWLNFFLLWLGGIPLWLSACRWWQQKRNSFVLTSSLPGTAGPGLSPCALEQTILRNDVTISSWHVASRWEYLPRRDCPLRPKWMQRNS